ncbi:hypothetical protein AAFF_G00073830 [Aldrovandia affinis]|uniref:Uncharacterized protein n=1 Tax=Aldrovandia affinis TaxID=143900 RepID=A0AAD7WDE9_9TELE|nr:hypothetical protein AAFF_G00073830 [Aldrovandia affinis]
MGNATYAREGRSSPEHSQNSGSDPGRNAALGGIRGPAGRKASCSRCVPSVPALRQQGAQQARSLRCLWRCMDAVDFLQATAGAQTECAATWRPQAVSSSRSLQPVWRLGQGRLLQATFLNAPHGLKPPHSPQKRMSHPQLHIPPFGSLSGALSRAIVVRYGQSVPFSWACESGSSEATAGDRLSFGSVSPQSHWPTTSQRLLCFHGVLKEPWHPDSPEPDEPDRTCSSEGYRCLPSPLPPTGSHAVPASLIPAAANHLTAWANWLC